MAESTRCQQCGVTILLTTAQKTGGVCRPCYKRRPVAQLRNLIRGTVFVCLFLPVGIVWIPFLILHAMITRLPDVLFSKRREARRLACETFQQLFPNTEISGDGGHVKYTESNRYIVEVCYARVALHALSSLP